LGPTQPPIQWETGALFLGIKQPGREADHSPPFSVEIKNAWSYISTPPIRLYGVVLSYKEQNRDNFTFYLYIYLPLAITIFSFHVPIFLLSFKILVLISPFPLCLLRSRLLLFSYGTPCGVVIIAPRVFVFYFPHQISYKYVPHYFSSKLSLV
jgi:hypothetical protein